MSGLRLGELDRTDERQIRALWELLRAAVAERRYNALPAWRAMRTYQMADRPDGIRIALLLRDDDQLVGAGQAWLPLHDNTHLAYVDVHVLPSRRRKGCGRMLATEVERRVRDHGRRVALTEVYAPVDEDGPGLAFARAVGYRVTLEDGVKVAELRATQATWPALAAEAAEHHRDYRIVTTWSPLPAELIEGYCRLNEAFNDLAPLGEESELETERWDEDRVRHLEELSREAGRHDARTFAVTADGEVVGMTEALVNETMPHRCFQGGTLVLPAHRGHRLGLAMKVANHAALLERFPELEWVVTGNADVNAAMNAVNDRLGFRVVERCVEMKKAL